MSSKWMNLKLEIELDKELVSPHMAAAIRTAFVEAGKLAALKMTLFDDSVGKCTLQEYDPDSEAEGGMVDIPLTTDEEPS
jgi:hypothetical protein